MPFAHVDRPAVEAQVGTPVEGGRKGDCLAVPDGQRTIRKHAHIPGIVQLAVDGQNARMSGAVALDDNLPVGGWWIRHGQCASGLNDRGARGYRKLVGIDHPACFGYQISRAVDADRGGDKRGGVFNGECALEHLNFVGLQRGAAVHCHGPVRPQYITVHEPPPVTVNFVLWPLTRRPPVVVSVPDPSTFPNTKTVPATKLKALNPDEGI